jgi:hypothetical protein
MKRIIFLCLSVLISASIWGQTEEWELNQTLNGVEIYTQEVACSDNNLPDQIAYLVKLVNTTNKNVKIEWDLAIWYNGKSVTGSQPSPENHHEVVVEKNTSKEGDCVLPRGALYIIKEFKAASSTTRLTKFEFQNIEVSKS